MKVGGVGGGVSGGAAPHKNHPTSHTDQTRKKKSSHIPNQRSTVCLLPSLSKEEAVESTVRTAITALDHDGVEVDFADDFGLEGEIHSSWYASRIDQGPRPSARIRKLNGGEQMGVCPPNREFRCRRVGLTLVVGEVKAEQCAILAIAAACGPLPRHGVGIIAFVDVD